VSKQEPIDDAVLKASEEAKARGEAFTYWIKDGVEYGYYNPPKLPRFRENLR